MNFIHPWGADDGAGSSRRRSRTRSPSRSSSTLTLSRSLSEELVAEQGGAELSLSTAREVASSVSRGRETHKKRRRRETI